MMPLLSNGCLLLILLWCGCLISVVPMEMTSYDHVTSSALSDQRGEVTKCSLIKTPCHKSPCRVQMDPIFNGSFVNCSSRMLSHFCPEWFPITTTTLLLDHNNLSCIANHSFQHLSKLRHLSIKHSGLYTIQVNALYGPKHLKTLNLEGNHLQCSDSVPEGMFQHVSSLQHLFLAFGFPCHDSCENCAYKGIFNAGLQLQSLSIDGSETLHVDERFAEFTNLTNVTVGCHATTNLTSSSLEGLRSIQLQELHLLDFGKYVDNFDMDVFENLTDLQTLVISGCMFGNQNIAQRLTPFADRTMTKIIISRSHPPRLYGKPSEIITDGTITNETVQYLKTICLSHFAWTESNLFAFKPRIMRSGKFPKCLKKLDLSYNRLGITGYLLSLMDLTALKVLEELIVSSERSSPDEMYPKLFNFSLAAKDKSEYFPKVLPNSKFQSQGENFISSDKTESSEFKDKVKLSESSGRIIVNGSTTGKKTGSVNRLAPTSPSSAPFSWHTGTIYYYCPESLRVVRGVGLVYGVVRFFNFTYKGVGCTNLTEFYYINNDILASDSEFLDFPFIRVLHLSENTLQVPTHFFDGFRGLEVLSLRRMSPGHFFRDLPCERILRNLSNLKYFDVSNNNLIWFSGSPFASKANLTHLILSKNRFFSIPFDLCTTPTLKVLDLSDNAILFLSQEDMAALETHVERVSYFILKLHGNSITCVCLQAKFINWLATTQRVELDDGGNYSCMSEGGELIYTADLFDGPAFYRQCEGRLYLMTALILMSLKVTTFLSAYLVLRFRTALEAFFLRLFVKAFRPMAPQDYRTHVFIGYADADFMFVKYILMKYLEEKLKVSTFIHQRDLLAHGYLADRLCTEISNSWRVLLVLSKNFLCEYELADVVMQYATHSVTAVNQRRVFVLVEESQVKAIPDYLHGVLEESQIIVLPDLRHQFEYKQRHQIKYCLQAG